MFRFHARLLILLSILLAACNQPVSPPATFTPSPVPQELPGVSLTMLLPGNGAVLSLSPTSAYVHFDGSSISTHPRELRLLVNGVPAGQPFVNTSGLIDFKRYLDWTPAGPGEYLLQAEAVMLDGDVARTPVTRVCVLDVNPEMFGGSVGDGSVYGYNGPCQIPTRLPPVAGTTQLQMSVLTSPTELTFRTPNQPTCIGQTPINLTFVATVTDPADDIVFVRATYQFIDNAFAFPLHNPGPALYHTLYLNWTSIEQGNQKIYRGTTEDLWQMLSDIWASGGITGRGSYIHWMVQGINRNSEASLFITGDVPMIYLNCIPGQIQLGPGSITETPVPLVILPSETPTLVPSVTPVVPPTFTLIKNAFCRIGPDMSFPDMTAIPKGDTVDILNISEDGFWYFVHWKKFDNKCWVAKGTGESSGDLTGLKVLIGPTLPAPNPSKPENKPGNPVEPPTPVKPPCNPLIKACP
jgi:hypothetical protein